MGTPDTKSAPSKEIDWEKRYKDLHPYATKLSQQNATLKAELKATQGVLPELIKPALSQEDREKLDDLLDVDPEAWRVKTNELEQQAAQQVQQRVAEATERLTKEEMLKLRNDQLDQFMADPNTVLTPEHLDMIPVGLVKQLEAGEIDFSTYLQKADAFVKGGIGGQAVKEPDPVIDGGTTEGTALTQEQAQSTYTTSIF